MRSYFMDLELMPHPCKISVLPLNNRYLESVVEIEKASFSDGWTMRAFEHELEVKSSHAYVALSVNKPPTQQVAGYICSWVCDSECSINKICVCKSFRRIGIGSLMFKHLIRETAKSAVDLYYIEVESGNSTAIAFYEKLGFKKTGIRKSYYRQGVDAVVMGLNRKLHGGKA